MQVGSAEDGAGWLAFFGDLTARGLTGVALVTSDAHRGLVEAIADETSADADHLVDRASRARVRSPQSHRRSQSGEQFLTTRTPGEATFDLGLLVDRLSYEWHSVSKS